MQYKALLLDVDGTTVPVGPHTKPSPAVEAALKEAKRRVAVSLVSGRSLEWLEELFGILELEHPCIINGGSQIINPQSREILWERPIAQESLRAIMSIIYQGNIPYIVSDDGVEYKEPARADFKKPLAIKLMRFASKESSDKCLERLLRIPGISAHKTYSWDKDRNYNQELYVTHAEATKKHAVCELAALLGVHPEEMIGVGDARNDEPMLSCCGLKIAMGNADDKLKAIADHIVAPVEEDGVAEVVERFILS